MVGTTEIPLFDDPVTVILPAGHPLAGQRSISLDELAAERWIAGCPLCRGHLLAACGALGVTPRIAHATDNSVAVLGLVAAGVGVALQPRLALEPLELPAGAGVHEVLPSSDRRVRAVHARGAEAVPTVAAVLSDPARGDRRTPGSAQPAQQGVPAGVEVGDRAELVVGVGLARDRPGRSSPPGRRAR